MNIKRYAPLVLAGCFLFSCNDATKQPAASADSTSKAASMTDLQKGSFAYDISFLREKDSGLVVLKSSDSISQVIVSPRYQAKVFTSTADGMQGKSFGWVNYKAFDGPLDTHMNAYGGEDRIWLGPEGGKYSLFFKPGAKMVFEEWHTPPAIDAESWQLQSSGENRALMTKDMELLNYAGTSLKIRMDRTIELIDKGAISSDLGVAVNDAVKMVAFKTTNTMTNAGATPWTETTGAPCMWSLDMFTPSEQCTIVIPYNAAATGKVATTDYFGEISKDRIKFNNGMLYFKADGKSRGKLGIPPARVKNTAGSFDAKDNVLTIIRFDINPSGKYLNQEWRTDREPYSGDAMNAYNDGPLEDGKQMGPFYELESVSPAAFLKPGEKLTHRHNVYHFTGDKKWLTEISLKVLGVSIEDIEKAF